MLIFFAIFYVLYLIFEFTVLDSHIEVWQSILKVMLLAVLLPLFSKKYIVGISSAEDLKKFHRTRRNIYLAIGLLITAAAIIFLVAFFSLNKTLIAG